MVFLEVATQELNDLAGLGNGVALGTLMMFALVFIMVMMLIMIGLYIYTSFAYMAIARKTKEKYPGLVWIPIVGKLLISSRIAKMHWWPILLLIILVIPVVNIFLGIPAVIVLLVFSIIWMWKTFEAISKPGWWAIFMLIAPVYWVLLGVAAWSKK